MQMQFPESSPNPSKEPSPRPLDTKRLGQVFNTALVHTRGEGAEDPKELFRLMEQPAFTAILGCVQSYAESRGLSEIDSAKELIRTFRKIDQIWTQYLIAEGTERLKV